MYVLIIFGGGYAIGQVFKRREDKGKEDPGNSGDPSVIYGFSSVNCSRPESMKLAAQRKPRKGRTPSQTPIFPLAPAPN